MEKFERGEKITDLSLLPPCEANLKHHIVRANYVTLIFTNAYHLIFNLAETINHGLDVRGRIMWGSVCHQDVVGQWLINYQVDEGNTDILRNTDWKMILMLQWKRMMIKDFFRHLQYLAYCRVLCVSTR